MLGGKVDVVLGAAGGDVPPEILVEVVEADEPLGTDLADDDLGATAGSSSRLYEPTSGDGIDLDDDGEALAVTAEGSDEGIGAEEAAVQVKDDQA